jgi:pimeloyl-ACP methyl ester carboxylesterase
VDFWTGVQNALRWNLVRMGASSAETRVDGVQVHFYDLAGQGKGPPIVLLHGLASSATSYARVMFLLTRRFRRVLVPELPGSGFSPEPSAGPLRLSLECREPKSVLGGQFTRWRNGAALGARAP